MTAPTARERAEAIGRAFDLEEHLKLIGTIQHAIEAAEREAAAKEREACLAIAEKCDHAGTVADYIRARRTS